MRIAIVGAGFRGLSVGYYLKKLLPGCNLIFFEKSDRVGGWIQSKRTKYGIAEFGARTIRSSGEGSYNIAMMCNDLGIQNDILTISKSHPASKNRYILKNGKIQKIQLLNPSYWKELLFFASRRKHKMLPNDSVESFFVNNFGPNFADLSSALCHGIYASNNELMSMRHHFPQIMQFIENGNGNLLLGLFRSQSFSPANAQNMDLWRQISCASVWTFKNGMQTITDALYAYLKNKSQFIFNSELKSVNLKNNSIDIDNHVGFDHVFWTSSCDGMFSGIDIIPKQSIHVTNLFYPKEVNYKAGFGILNTKSEMKSNLKYQNLLGVIFDSQIRKGIGTQFTLMLGGHNFKEANTKEIILQCKKLMKDLILKQDYPLLHYEYKLQRKCIPYFPTKTYAQSLEKAEILTKKFEKKISLISQDYTGVGMTQSSIVAKKSVESFITSMGEPLN
eukprot:NODE_1149_length_2003_cov_1.005777.p1 type:complete len:447 gc:universal NODE_1149_length_2003_cov_1.005777:1661-321(-)